MDGFEAMIVSRTMTNVILATGALIAAFAIGSFIFVGGRYLAARLFRVPNRLAPFGEAPGASYKEARTGARLAIAAAGPAAIYLFSAVIVALGLLLQGETFLGGTHVNVVPSRPAHAAGMLDGDQVISINGAPVSSWDKLSATVRAHPGEALAIEVMRGGQKITLTVTPGEKGAPDEGKIGVAARPGKVTFGDAIGRGLKAPLRVVEGIRDALGRNKQVEMAGPVGVVREMSRDPTAPGYLVVTVGLILSTAILPTALVGSLLLLPLEPGRAPSEKDRNKDGDRAPLAPPRRARSGRRLWARALDVIFLAVLTAIPPLADASDVIFRPILFLYVPVEALLLSTVGFTPGKWLLGIFVRDAGGRRLSFRVALRRSAGVFVWGLGLVTVIGPVTALIAHRRLKKRGATYWDELDALEVHEEKVSTWRVVIAAAVLAFGVLGVALSPGA
jgi:uncharacterized RDD family membrane protein YckC